MPVNPYAEDEIRRRAQLGAMSGEPRNGTLPIGVRDQVTDLTGGRNGGFVNPQAAPPVPQRQTPSAGGGDRRSQFLDIANRFPSNRTGRDAMLADPVFREAFPDARLHKSDWVDFGPGVGLIDTINSFDEQGDTGNGWQWLTEADAIAGKAKPQNAGGAQFGGINPALDNSSLARIMAELNATANDEQSPAAREAILAMLNGGI